MAFLTGVDLSPKRLTMTRPRVRGHVDRILWIVSLHHLTSERHAGPINSGNNTDPMVPTSNEFTTHATTQTSRSLLEPHEALWIPV